MRFDLWWSNRRPGVRLPSRGSAPHPRESAGIDPPPGKPPEAVWPPPAKRPGGAGPGSAPQPARREATGQRRRFGAPSARPPPHACRLRAASLARGARPPAIVRQLWLTGARAPPPTRADGFRMRSRDYRMPDFRMPATEAWSTSLKGRGSRRGASEASRGTCAAGRSFSCRLEGCQPQRAASLSRLPSSLPAPARPSRRHGLSRVVVQKQAARRPAATNAAARALDRVHCHGTQIPTVPNTAAPDRVGIWESKPAARVAAAGTADLRGSLAGHGRKGSKKGRILVAGQRIATAPEQRKKTLKGVNTLTSLAAMPEAAKVKQSLR
jgi:hypothetical protein